MDASEQVAEKTYRAIGRFMYEFSQAEFTIRHYLADEIGLEEKFFSTVIESYDVGLLCTVAKKVFSEKRTERNAALIKKLIDRFRALNDKRNRIAHGLWVPFKEGGTVHYVSRQGLIPKRFENQAQDLEILADDVCYLRVELENAFLPS